MSENEPVSVDMLVSVIGEQAVEIRLLRRKLAQVNAVLESVRNSPQAPPLANGDEEGGMGDAGLEARTTDG